MACLTKQGVLKSLFYFQVDLHIKLKDMRQPRNSERKSGVWGRKLKSRSSGSKHTTHTHLPNNDIKPQQCPQLMTSPEASVTDEQVVTMDYLKPVSRSGRRRRRGRPQSLLPGNDCECEDSLGSESDSFMSEGDDSSVGCHDCADAGLVECCHMPLRPALRTAILRQLDDLADVHCARRAMTSSSDVQNSKLVNVPKIEIKVESFC